MTPMVPMLCRGLGGCRSDRVACHRNWATTPQRARPKEWLPGPLRRER